MAWVRKTMIAADAVVDTCRQMAVAVAGNAGANMWTTPLSPNGALPATHWISAGCIEESFAGLIASPESLAAGTGIPVEQAAAILAQCIVSDDDPHAVIAVAGLKLVQGDGLTQASQG